MKRWIGLILLCTQLIVSGCSSVAPEALNVDIRSQAVKEGALTFGAQTALAWRAKMIEHAIVQQNEYLDRIYRFQDLLLAHNVLPPILSASSNDINQPNTENLRIADQVIAIVQDAKIVTTAPTWMDYLTFTMVKAPDLPDATLLPRDAAEKQIWDENMLKGWEKGKEQAKALFEIGMGRLNRDFLGLLLYRNLLSQKIVTRPYTATANLGITGDKYRIRLNDKVVKIVKRANLTPAEVKTWEPVIISNRVERAYKR
jgi:defect in organelle trafficking protein DotC